MAYSEISSKRGVCYVDIPLKKILVVQLGTTAIGTQSFTRLKP